MPTKCTESVSGSGRWGALYGHRCRNAATVERDGKGYCKTHDPVTRRERQDTKMNARIAANVARQRAIEAAGKRYAGQVVACTDEEQASRLVREIVAWGGGWRR